MKACYLPEESAFLRYLEIPGDDPPLLWLHGWQCSSTGELLPVAVQEPLRGRRSLVVDLLGHGYSDRPLDFGYALEDHARTIVALIDAIGLASCGLVGHSMGGGIAVRVAAARPGIVSLLVMAEGALDGDDETPFDGQSEDAYAGHIFPQQLASQAAEAAENPSGLRAAHVGITRTVEPRAIYREAISLSRRGDPSMDSLLGSLQIPCWYLQGALSDPAPNTERIIRGMNVNWTVVPDTGHAMGLQNPLGFATAVAGAIAQSWPATT
jgi:pimeloyl-ACP methyl ester carboxylesterase